MLWKDNNSYVVVEKGDNLTKIAKEATSKLGKKITVDNLVAWNSISNRNLIYVGQKIYMSNSGSSSSSSSSASDDLVIKHFGKLADPSDDKTLVAVWSWDKDHTEKFKVEWTYGTGTGIWFNGNSGDVAFNKDNPSLSKYSTYSIPDNAINIRFRVQPISEKYKDKKDKEISYWTHKWSGYKYHSEKHEPETNGKFEVEVDGEKLKIALREIATAGDATKAAVTDIQFQIRKNRNNNQTSKATIKVRSGTASYVYTGATGGTYEVRYRAYNSGNKLCGEWTEYSSPYYTIPPAPKMITDLRAHSSSSVFIAWTKVNLAEEYEIEYTDNKSYFGGVGPTQSETITPDESTGLLPIRILIGAGDSALESGKEYFFRVRAKWQGKVSKWTGIKSVVLGRKPAAPTTWSSTSSTSKNGPNVTLNWIHNSNDGSIMQEAQIEYIADDGSEKTLYIKNSDESLSNDWISYTKPVFNEEEDPEPSYSCTLKVSTYKNGAKFTWRVRTAGIYSTPDPNPVPGSSGKILVFSEWSTMRTIDIYDEPHLALMIRDSENGEGTSFPIYVEATATPNDELQKPTGYHVTITSQSSYETLDNLGETKFVGAGDEVYAKYFNPDFEGALMLMLTPGDISLENDVEYQLTCVASMSSGLVATSSVGFTPNLGDKIPAPNAEISIDEETLTASILPYCEKYHDVYYQLYHNTQETKFWSSSATEPERIMNFVPSGTEMGCVGKNGELTTRRTTAGSIVYLHYTDEGKKIYFAKVRKGEAETNVYLSVYRREYDGSFTEIAAGLDSADHATVVDPHPTLDYARYRIVATSKTSGEIAYRDLPGYPVNCSSIVLQWDESWTSFDVTADRETPAEQAWSGSMLKLPYNVDVSDTVRPECTLVEYAGRSHPVSYYGTHLGSTASWSTEIPRDDLETIYALRRLSRWMGDVYVREPSGSGYWANVQVSFSLNHCEVTVPVSMSITRVEGGV